MVSEIEKDYSKILEDFEVYVQKLQYTANGTMVANEGFGNISEQSLLTLIRTVMGFPRKIEYSLDTTQKLMEKTGNTKRLVALGLESLARLNSTKDSFGIITYYYDSQYKICGVIPLLRTAHDRFLKEEFKEVGN
jgi:hypothetical protein